MINLEQNFVEDITQKNKDSYVDFVNVIYDEIMINVEFSDAMCQKYNATISNILDEKHK